MRKILYKFKEGWIPGITWVVPIKDSDIYNKWKRTKVQNQAYLFNGYSSKYSGCIILRYNLDHDGGQYKIKEFMEVKFGDKKYQFMEYKY